MRKGDKKKKRKNRDEIRSARKGVRFTSDELGKIQIAAISLHMNFSEFVRCASVALADKLTWPADEGDWHK